MAQFINNLKKHATTATSLQPFIYKLLGNKKTLQ